MLNDYLIENYNKLKDMAYNIGGQQSDDLLSFIIEELYRCDQERINEIIENKQMTFYIVRVMLNQFNSKTSRYYYKYNRYYEYHITGIIESISPDNVEFQIEKKEQFEKRLKWVQKKLKDLHWFDSTLFKIYYLDSHSLNTLTKATKIPRATIYKVIKRVKKHLKNEIC